jgi:hypothetical protein
MKRNDFRIGDRVVCNKSYVGRVDYHLANGRILVRDSRGNTKAYWPDAIELAEPRPQDDDDDEEEEPALACRTPQKLQEAIEIIEGLMSRKRGGATLVRLHSLICSCRDDFFSQPDDYAAPFPDDEIVGELIRSEVPF